MGQTAFPSSAIIDVPTETVIARLSSGTGAAEEVTLANFFAAWLSSLPTVEPVATGLPWLSSGVLTVAAGIAPVIGTQPANAEASDGETATFNVVATNATSYQWQLDSGSGFAAISGATSASYTTPALTASENGGQYRVVVTGPGGTVTSNAATLIVSTEWTPASLTGSVWLEADSNVFTEITGASATTPAVNAGPVGTWRCKNGTGINFVAESTGSRPSLQTTGINSLPAILFGTDLWLSVLSSDFIRNKPGATLCVVAKTDTLQTTPDSTRFVQVQTATGGTRFDVGQDSNGSSNFIGTRRLDSDSNTFFRTGTAGTTSEIQVARVNWLTGGSAGLLHIKNGTILSSNSLAGTGNCQDTASARINVGGIKTDSIMLPFFGRIAAVVISPTALSDADVRRIEEYWAGKYTITIAELAFTV